MSTARVACAESMSEQVWSLLEMFPHDAKLWFHIAQEIGLLDDTIGHHGPDEVVEKEWLARRVGWVADECAALRLKVSAEFARNMLNRVDREILAYSYKELQLDVAALRRAIEAELGTILVMRVSPDYEDYSRNKQPFGPEFSDMFPSAVPDVESAARAIAFGLGTAAVFHLMRVMEVGLKVLAKSLDIDYLPSWESYFGHIGRKLDARHQDKSEEWRRLEPLYRDLAGDLQFVKICWRNPTMHIERQYSQEEGAEVFRAVRAFMSRLGHSFSETRGKFE